MWESLCALLGVPAVPLSVRLEALLPALQAAPVLAGVEATGRSVNPDGSYTRAGDNTVNARDLLLPLSVDVTGLHRRKVWDAWEITQRTIESKAKADQDFNVHVPEPTRTGRWGRAAQIGRHDPLVPAR